MAEKRTRYKVRLEDPGSDEFRISVLDASSPEEAASICEERERKHVAYSLTDEQVKAAEEALKADDKTIAINADVANPKGQLHLHRQSVPYKVVSVVGRDESAGSSGTAKKGGDS